MIMTVRGRDLFPVGRHSFAFMEVFYGALRLMLGDFIRLLSLQGDIRETKSLHRMQNVAKEDAHVLHLNKGHVAKIRELLLSNPPPPPEPLIYFMS